MEHKIDSLESLFFEELKDIYDAEHQLLEVLPKMAQAASNQDLKRGFEEHHRQTREQIQRLEQIFDAHQTDPSGKKCKGMQGIINDGQELMNKKDANKDALDAGLIAAAQKAEHYEIASYGTARTYAEQLGMKHEANILQTTLEEESRTNEKLNDLAVNRINWEAIR